ncbi:MAG: chlorophyll synthesis pathway protein BchC, partial [Myxococcota bacterium]
TVGRILEAPKDSALKAGDTVFVPGASCFGEDVRSLFGGSASTLWVSPERLVPIDPSLESKGVLLALAATAQHAIARATELPELIIGHGCLGRLLARLVVAAGGHPVVWERNASRMDGAEGYSVVAPDDDLRHDYGSIVDVSGDSTLLDSLILRLRRGGELVLAGFYPGRIDFAFPMAFMKEASLRIAAEWARPDMDAVLALLDRGALDLGGLITHRRPFYEADDAYPTAFDDASCLKMALDWSTP